MKRTPDEIKKGLECCKEDECFGDRENCPYTADPNLCVGVMCADALALIQQLEADKQQLEGMLTHMNQLRDAAAGRALKMEERVHQLEAERDAAVDTMPRWISVEERLPEEAESVLVRIRLCDATWYEVAHRINGRWSTTCITHWMPIPQPPKEE